MPSDPEEIERAAAAIRAGKLVVMPTETVYGLAANALDPEAVAKIFEAKGRPSDNPLIVHVCSTEMARTVASELPDEAFALMKAYWPGPLTLVLRKRPEVPAITTAALDTVAVRMPNHPTALALIEASGMPLAAPSANRFGGVSPTAAEHLDCSLVAKAAAVLDAGPCDIGIESTVLDLSGEQPRLLRPGAIGKDELERILGRTVSAGAEAVKRSPGMYPKHYAPTTPVFVVDALGERPGLTFGPAISSSQIKMPQTPAEYARQLYAAFHHLDKLGLSAIYVEMPPEGAEWDAARDRLERATAR